MFKLAVKHESKLRMAIIGSSGSGKTYTSLVIASHLVPGGKIAVVDTEHGSAAKYSDLFTFDVMEMEAPFHPERFIEAITAAENGGYSVLIIDSLSHAWNGPGGLLELKENFSKQRAYNDYTAWGPAGEIQNHLVQALTNAKIHLIATMRSKMKYAMQEVEENGYKKTKVVKLGLDPVQRNDFEYEFDVIGDMDTQNHMEISKTRCSALTGRVIAKPGKELADTLATWLSGTPAPESPLLPEFNYLGVVTYGDSWDDKRPELCLSVSKRRTNRSDNLTDEELGKLIEGMKKRVNGNGHHRPTPEPTIPAEPELPAAQEPLFPDDEPMAFKDAYAE